MSICHNIFHWKCLTTRIMPNMNGILSVIVFNQHCITQGGLFLLDFDLDWINNEDQALDRACCQ